MSGEELNTAADSTSPGAVLARTREELGITQREVSDALNLPINTVVAIEADDKAQLPAHVFTRGYIRAYAKLLELDPEPLVAAMGPEQGDDSKDSTLVSQTAGGQTAGGNGALPPGLDMSHLLQPRNLAVGAGVVLIIIVLVVVLLGGDTQESPAAQGNAPGVDVSAQSDASAATEPDQTEAEILPAESMPRPMAIGDPERLPDVAETGAESESTSEPAPAVTDSASVQSSASVQGEAPPVAAAQADPDEGARRLTSAGSDRLSLQFTEDCWVEIKDGSGKVLFGDLGRTGQSWEFVGAAPFTVLLGYAPGAVLSFNAEPVALGPHTRNNVASLVVGQ